MTEQALQKNPVGWFEIYVNDLERAKEFYQFVFQVKLEKLALPSPEMWAFPMATERWGAGGSLVFMPGFSAGRNSVIVYFNCEDCALQVERAVQAGGRVERSKFSIGPYGFIALVYDTEGNLIGLHSLH